MREIVLWGDVGARLVIATLLLIVPRLTASTFGLPRITETFWPRMLAAILLAIAAGTIIDGRWPGKGGPALGGLATLNAAASFALATALVVGQLEIPKRGRLVLWLIALGSAVLALLQLAWI